MDADREDRLDELQRALATLPPSEWLAFLDSACRDDISLRDEVLLRQRMLESVEIVRRTTTVIATNTGTTSPETPARCGQGTRLRPYAIRSTLDAGSMAEVYRARDTKLGRDVAIKILPHAFTDDPEYLARFDREARVLAALNHPNIAAIYGIEEAPLSLSVGLNPAPAGAATQEPVTALVLELVQGETLAGRISSAHGPLRVQEALDFAQQIAAALEAAHEKGIVHRDLKPANIMITPDGVVKVLDFGLARITSNAGTGRSSHVLTAIPDPTREGVILGTPAYMSPEQTLGLPVDKRMDIWAFGCVVYEILTGR